MWRLGLPAGCPASGETVKSNLKPNEVWAVWIEGATAPAQRSLVLLVVRVGQYFEELLVTWRATAVFRRAAADGFEQEQVSHAVHSGHNLLQLEGVGPV